MNVDAPGTSPQDMPSTPSPSSASGPASMTASELISAVQQAADMVLTERLPEILPQFLGPHLDERLRHLEGQIGSKVSDIQRKAGLNDADEVEMDFDKEEFADDESNEGETPRQRRSNRSGKSKRNKILTVRACTPKLICVYVLL